MLQQRPLSRAGSEWGLSEPNPIPWPSSQPGGSPSTFPFTPEKGRKKKKNLLERLYNGSQPACHIAQPMRSTRSQRARAGSRPSRHTAPHGQGDGQPAPAFCPSPPHPVPGLAEAAQAPSHPPAEGFPYFLAGSCFFSRLMPARARLVCLHF